MACSWRQSCFDWGGIWSTWRGMDRYSSFFSAIAALAALIGLTPNPIITTCFVAVLIHVVADACEPILEAPHYRSIVVRISLLARILAPLILSIMFIGKVGWLLLFVWVLFLIWEAYTLRAYLLQLFNAVLLACDAVGQACAGLCNAVRQACGQACAGLCNAVRQACDAVGQACAGLCNAVRQACAGHGNPEDPNGV